MSDRKPEPLLNGKALSSLRVVDLKQELEKRGCSKSGTKKDLVDRLRTRLEFEQMQQSAPSVDTERSASLSDGEPNDFVKAYLAEQQQSYQKQIEIRQQVISETEVPVTGSSEPAATTGASAPPPVDQAEDLSSNKQTSDSSPTRRSLRSASVTDSSATPTGPSEETVLEMPAAVPEAVPAVISSHTPSDRSDSTGETHDEPEQKEDAAKNGAAEVVIAENADEKGAAVAPDPIVSDVQDKVEQSNSVATLEAASVVSVPVTDAEPIAKLSENEVVATPSVPSVEAAPSAVISVPVVVPQAAEIVSESKMEVTTATEVAAASDAAPSSASPVVDPPAGGDHKIRGKSSSPKKEERHQSPRKDRHESGREEEGEKRTTPRDRGSDRRRLVIDKKEEVGDEAKAKPKRKWGSGSERQFSRGISSSQLNSLLPKSEKVSVGSQEESQAGADSGAENISMSGKFSRSANGSVDMRLPAADHPDPQETPVDQKPVNGQPPADSVIAASDELAPARNPPSNVLFVENLTRPFTLPALHSLLRTYGSIDVDKFWIDKIKSMCLVAYASVEEAEAARKALSGTRWPSSNPKTLVADFSNEEEIVLRKTEAEKPDHQQQQQHQSAPVRNASDKYDITIRKTFTDEKDASSKPVRDWDRDKLSPPPSKRSRRSPSPAKRADDKHDAKMSPEPECSAKLLDDLFKKTKSSPVIYWLPLTEIEAEQRLKHREEEREKRRQEREVPRPIRRSPPPPPPQQQQSRAVRSPPRGRNSYRGGMGDRSRPRSRSVSRSRSRSPVRNAGRYRSPMRRGSPPTRRR